MVDLNGIQWRYWSRVYGEGCGGDHHRQMNSRWRPLDVVEESGRERGWRGRGRWEGVRLGLVLLLLRATWLVGQIVEEE